MIKDVDLEPNTTDINSKFYNESFINPEMDYTVLLIILGRNERSYYYVWKRKRTRIRFY